MGSGLLAEGLGEAAHQILKDIAAVHCADFVGPEVALMGGVFLDDEIQGVAVHHALDDVVKIELCQHVLHVGRETVQIIPEVALDILRVRQQPVEGELARVIKLIARRLAEKTVRDRQLLHLFPGVENSLVRGQQAIVEALHDGHRENDQAVFVGLKRPAQQIRHVPNHRGFFLNVGSDYCDFIVRHADFSSLIRRRFPTAPCRYQSIPAAP